MLTNANHHGHHGLGLGVATLFNSILLRSHGTAWLFHASGALALLRWSATVSGLVVQVQRLLNKGLDGWTGSPIFAQKSLPNLCLTLSYTASF